MKIERIMSKNLEYYLSLPYTIMLRWDGDDEIFVAHVDELPGCSAHGATEATAISNLRDNMQVWIEDCLEAGDPIPEPAQEIELPSGKWLQRVPRSLHSKLIRLAKKEGVSLNQLVSSALAEAVGMKSRRAEHAKPVVVESKIHSRVSSMPFGSILVDGYQIVDEMQILGQTSYAIEEFSSRLDFLPKSQGEPGHERSLHAQVKKRVFTYQN
jgi:predicted RNase H-like HicB family nuclease